MPKGIRNQKIALQWTNPHQDIYPWLTPPLLGQISENKGGSARIRILADFGPRFWPFSLVKSPFRGPKIPKFSRLRRVFPLLQPMNPLFFFVPAARQSGPQKDLLLERFPLTTALNTPKFSPPAARSSRSQNLRSRKLGGVSQKGGGQPWVYVLITI